MKITYRSAVVSIQSGNASYQRIEDGETKTISDKEYLNEMEDYGKGTVVNFGYGASDNPY